MRVPPVPRNWGPGNARTPAIQANDRLVTAQNLAATTVASQYANMYGCWSYDRGPRRQVFVAGVEDPYGNRTGEQMITGSGLGNLGTRETWGNLGTETWGQTGSSPQKPGDRREVPRGSIGPTSRTPSQSTQSAELPFDFAWN
jgi:hypothetical protein